MSEQIDAAIVGAGPYGLSLAAGHTGQNLAWAKPDGDGLRLAFGDARGANADQVIAATGPAVAATFGPVMRFACGAQFPARAVLRRCGEFAAAGAGSTGP